MMAKTTKLGLLAPLGLTLLVTLAHNACQAKESLSSTVPDSNGNQQIQLKAAGPATSVFEQAALASQDQAQTKRATRGFLKSSERSSQRSHGPRMINYGHLFDSGAKSSRLAPSSGRSFELEPTGGKLAERKRRTSKQRRLKSAARSLSSLTGRKRSLGSSSGRSLGASSTRKSRARAAKLSRARALKAARLSQSRSMRFRREAASQLSDAKKKNVDDSGEFFDEQADSDKKPEVPTESPSNSTSNSNAARHLGPFKFPQLGNFQQPPPRPPNQPQPQFQPQLQFQQNRAKSGCACCNSQNNVRSETIDRELEERPTQGKLAADQSSPGDGKDSSPSEAITGFVNGTIQNSQRLQEIQEAQQGASVGVNGGSSSESELKLSGSRVRPKGFESESQPTEVQLNGANGENDGQESRSGTSETNLQAPGFQVGGSTSNADSPSASVDLTQDPSTGKSQQGEFSDPVAPLPVVKKTEEEEKEARLRTPSLFGETTEAKNESAQDKSDNKPEDNQEGGGEQRGVDRETSKLSPPGISEESFPADGNLQTNTETQVASPGTEVSGNHTNDEEDQARTSDAKGQLIAKGEALIDKLESKKEEKKAVLGELVEAKSEKLAALGSALAKKKEKKKQVLNAVIDIKLKKFKKRPKPKPAPVFVPPPPPPPPSPVYQSTRPVYPPILGPRPPPNVKQPYTPNGPAQSVGLLQSASSKQSSYVSQPTKKCQSKIQELSLVLKEVVVVVDVLGKKVTLDDSIELSIRESLSRKLSKIGVAAEEALLAAKLGKLRLLNDTAKVAGVELIRLGQIKEALRLESSVKKWGAKLRRIYGLYRKSCKSGSYH